jgi:hypothetical protein
MPGLSHSEGQADKDLRGSTHRYTFSTGSTGAFAGNAGGM